MKASLLGLPVLLFVTLTSACGGSDQNGNGGSGGKGGGDDTGGGGAGGTTATGTDTETGTGTGNNGGGTTTDTGSGGSGNGGGSAGGGGAGAGGPCGGETGACGDTAYCDYDEDNCGANDGIGTCVPKPEGCGDIYQPVCACDGKVYSNACDAAAAGQDLNLLGVCPAPEEWFPCGSGFCQVGVGYCQIQVSDVAGVPDTYTCEELPPACTLPGATCSCLSDLPCSENCELEDGAFTVTCPGG